MDGLMDRGEQSLFKKSHNEEIWYIYILTREDSAKII